MKHKKKNRDRFSLMWFYTANGLDPYFAKLYVLANDFKNGKLFVEKDLYDKHALLHLRQMEKQARTGSWWKGEKLTYDMILQRVVKK